MTPLTKTENKLYLYLKRRNGDASTSQMVKHMEWNGKYAEKEVCRMVNKLQDKGAINISYIPLQRIITVL